MPYNVNSRQQGLPNARSSIIAPGAGQAPSQALDDLQDCIVQNAKPTMSKTFYPISFNGFPANWTLHFGVDGAWMIASASPAAFVFSIPMEQGDRITGFSVLAYGDGSADCTYTVFVQPPGMDVFQTLATYTDSNRAAAWGIAQLKPFTAHTLAAGEIVLVYVQPNAANYRISTVRMTYYRLLPGDGILLGTLPTPGV